MALFYHSNATPSGVAGVCRISKASFPDTTALDPKSQYYPILKPQKKIPSGCWSKWNLWKNFPFRLPRGNQTDSQTRRHACLKKGNSPLRHAHRKAAFYTHPEAWAKMNFNGFNGRSSLLQESVLWHKSQAKIAKIFTNNQFEGDQRD